MRPGGWPLIVALTTAACSQSGPVTALHVLSPSTVPIVKPTLTNDFYLLPFPNDLRLSADGTVDLTTYPRAVEGGLIEQYIDTLDEGLRGAGTNAGIYFRFDGAIDPATLPKDGNASLDGTATAFVVDVTPGSPTYGKKSPVVSHFVTAAHDFIGPFWLTLLPFPGLPLREKTTYAAVLTDGIHAMGGGPVQRAPDFDGAMKTRSVRAYAPLTAWLDTQPGLAGRVVNATVFTTVDATSIMFKLRQAIYDTVPAPTLDGLTYVSEDKAGVDQIFEGTFLSPNFQEGLPPYASHGSGGQIRINANGLPEVTRMETLRVALTVPEGQMPAAGWPVVLYAHGTGGSYQSFINDGSGSQAAEIGQMAMLSIDQVLHGPRDPSGSNVELTFFNFPNIVAAHDNPKQGALDDFQLLRLVKGVNVAAAPTTGQPIKFDPERIYFKGHSQGGLTGPLFLAAEPEVKAAVLSGAGGVLIFTLLNKLEPVNIPQAVGALFQDPVDQFHPVLSLVQAYFEDTDPQNYARLFFKEPPPGMAPKSVFMSLGLIDKYTPVPNIKAFALGMGLQPIHPMLDTIDGLDLAGLSWGAAPMSGNVAGGAATGVVLEYNQAAGSDGHFVIFRVPAAIQQSNQFLASHSLTGVASLVAP